MLNDLNDLNNEKWGIEDLGRPPEEKFMHVFEDQSEPEFLPE
jgi:hypothetical protein